MSLSCQVEDAECEIQDVSYTGLCFSSKKPLEPDTTKELALPIRGEDGKEKVLRVRAEIRWCKEAQNGGYLVGAEVTVTSREDEAEFVAFLFRKSLQAYLDKEAELIELESYRSLVEMAADPILVVHEGEIVFLNQAAVEMFGYASDELKGMEFDRLILSGPHAAVSPPSSLSPLGEPCDPYYYTLRKADGKPVDVEIRSRSILYRHRTATLSILHDLTGRKQFEQKLIQVERLKVLGEMSAGIAHDVNNSLLVILGVVEMIQQETQDEAIVKALRTIETAALDGAATIRRVQGFGRLQDDKNVVLLDANKIVSEARIFTRPKWQEEPPRNRGWSIEVSENLADEAMIRANPSDVRQALVNLMINAVDAMPRGGEIELRTEVEEETVTISVRDTGLGIPRDIKDRIFDPFFSTKGERGSGLGLSTVYGIMAKHRGSVTVESVEGEGTVVRLHFPLGGETGPGLES